MVQLLDFAISFFVSPVSVVCSLDVYATVNQITEVTFEGVVTYPCGDFSQSVVPLAVPSPVFQIVPNRLVLSLQW